LALPQRAVYEVASNGVDPRRECTLAAIPFADRTEHFQSKLALDFLLIARVLEEVGALTDRHPNETLVTPHKLTARRLI
jgi:hypothetical protein